jgi:hypothetical protein
MIIVMVLLARRADLTREAYIDYYETRHAPLAPSTRIFRG